MTKTGVTNQGRVSLENWKQRLEMKERGDKNRKIGRERDRERETG